MEECDFDHIPRYELYNDAHLYLPRFPRMPRRLTSSPDSVISEFLNGLPSYDAENFSLHSDAPGRATRRPAYHLPTTESPPEQVIVPERSNILLRYLHQKWEKEEGLAGQAVLRQEDVEWLSCDSFPYDCTSKRVHPPRKQPERKRELADQQPSGSQKRPRIEDSDDSSDSS